MSFRPTASSAARKTYFEQQRELLLGEIAMSFEQVLANINKLNRSLEAVTTVGNEFSAVEALWSQFEGVMAKDEAPVQAEPTEEQGDEQGGEHAQAHAHDDEVQPTVEGVMEEAEDKTDMEIEF